jgi:glycosyltransferase involved in cell wall biosynthesis
LDLKIAHFSWEFPPVIWGGLGTFALEISQKQVSKGNKVTVFSLNNQNKLNNVDTWKGIEVLRPYNLDITSTLYLFSNEELRSWGSNFKFFADVFEYNLLSASHFTNFLVRQNNRDFDVIDAHDWLGILGGMIVKRKLDLPLIFHIHSTEEGRSLGGGSQTIKNIELEGGKNADCIITVSYAMKEELGKLGFPMDKIRVCWNGVDPNKYNPEIYPSADRFNLRKQYGIKNDEYMLFFVGRLVTVKGADKLVQAMPSVLQDFPNTKLVLLGIGDMETTLQKTVKDMNLANNVILRNEFVNEEERILHYAASDVVILPSLYEPFGIVCTEAMSMGKPVVVGAKGTNGMREQVISNGEKQCGIHINPFDPTDIAWGIKQVLGSKEKRTQMGKNARERVIEHFNWDIITEKTLEIYREFIDRKL